MLTTLAADLRQAVTIADICGTQQLKEAATRAASKLEERSSPAHEFNLRDKLVGRLLVKLDGEVSPAKLRLLANDIAEDIIRTMREA